MKFMGLCIGGPRDGEFVEHFDKMLRTPVMKPMRPVSQIKATDVDFEICVYKHQEIQAEGGKLFGFWLEKDMSFAQIMTLLTQSYADRAMRIKSGERHQPMRVGR